MTAIRAVGVARDSRNSATPRERHPGNEGTNTPRPRGDESPEDRRNDPADTHPDGTIGVRADGAITVRRDGAVVTVRVGTGRRANALATRDWQALADVFDALARDPELAAVVVAGRGPATFSAGSDMREWLSADPAGIDLSFAAMERALSAVERVPVPVVAQVRGSAVGAGCQLACACDLRIVADDARIGMPIARWGILVPPAFAARLSLLTGPATARDLLLTGRLVDGAEAVRLGLPPPASRPLTSTPPPPIWSPRSPSTRQPRSEPPSAPSTPSSPPPATACATSPPDRPPTTRACD
jgi:hypothetical protein